MFTCYFIPDSDDRRRICNYIEHNNPDLFAISLRCESFPQTSTVRFPVEQFKCGDCKFREITFETNPNRLFCYKCYNYSVWNPEDDKLVYYVPNGNVILICDREQFKGWHCRKTMKNDIPTDLEYQKILDGKEKFTVEIPKHKLISKADLARYIDMNYK